MTEPSKAAEHETEREEPQPHSEDAEERVAEAHEFDDGPLSDSDGGADGLSAMMDAQMALLLQQQDAMRHFLQMMRAAYPQQTLTDEERLVLSQPLPTPLETADIAGVAKYIAEGRAKNIIVMRFAAQHSRQRKIKKGRNSHRKARANSGAGISVSAGIPDFRTPGTGLYDNVQKYNFDDPQDLFTLSVFRENPRPFYEVAKVLYPDKYHPTKAHYFVRLLHEHGLLLRDFTQNIDTLERVAQIPTDKVVFSHGSFSAAHCIDCHKEFSFEHVRDKIFADEQPTCDVCSGHIKPDIVFFGESLPERFFEQARADFPRCDLLIVMGTSLCVQPFAGLIARVADHVPRLLINREAVAVKSPPPPPDAPEYVQYRHRTSAGFAFNVPGNRRDALFLGDCDDGVQALADALGWGKELQDMFDAPL